MNTHVNQSMPLRILLVDDEQEILDIYKEVLLPAEDKNTAARKKLSELDNKLFGQHRVQTGTSPYSYDLTFAQQGVHAVEAVRKSIEEHKPYAVAFVDMRMPPGLDGLWTAQHIRELDPNINIVIVTAYTDVDPLVIAEKVLPEDKLLYIQKPFHVQEIRQFATTLSAKWMTEISLQNLNSELERKVEERTAELSVANKNLIEENLLRKKNEMALLKAEEELKQKSHDLEGLNTAISLLYKNKDEERREFEKKVIFNVTEMIEPYIEKLAKTDLGENQQALLNVIKENLNDIVAPFMSGMYYKYFRLTPKEIHIANLIKQGKSSKEIGQLLNKSQRTIEFYRDKIRDKVGIKNKKANLRSVLQQLDIDFQP